VGRSWLPADPVSRVKVTDSAQAMGLMPPELLNVSGIQKYAASASFAAPPFHRRLP
jgi:hypothetical protein